LNKNKYYIIRVIGSKNIIIYRKIQVSPKIYTKSKNHRSHALVGVLQAG